MQRQGNTSNRDYLKEQHRMLTKICLGIFGPEKIEIKSELTSFDKILYSFPVVDFLES